MNKCTEITERWLKMPSDDSPDELDAFFAHVEVCPFHAEVFRTEEEGLRSMCRLARGLDSHGRLLVGNELEAAITKLDHGQAIWKEVAPDMKLPFKRIYLSNRGEDIAGSGKFFDFRKYEGDHQLDAQAGLQIWGVIGDRDSTEALLGFYPLAGVRHTGQEELLKLDNGYTVGLRVDQRGERNFEVGFRCVENEVLEQERTELESIGAGGAAAGLAKGAGSSFLGRCAERADAFISFLVLSTKMNFRQRVAAVTICCLAVAVTIGAVVYHKKGGRLEPIISAGDPEPSCAVQVNPNSMDARPGTEATAKVATQTQSAIGKTALKGNRVTRHSHPGRTTTTGTETGTEEVVVSDIKPIEPQSTSNATAEASTLVAPGVSVWYFQSVRFSDIATAKRITVHSGFDGILREKLSAEMRKQDIDIVPLDNQSCSLNKQVTITWSIIRQDKSVTVEAKLTADGDVKVLTFRSGGTCPEQACDRAVRDAVAGVFAVMRDIAIKDEAAD